jgi:glycosyltransferase involved in cell wall biosynthesis
MSRLPFVSLLLPIRNEAACIRRCLEAILAQDYPGGMEILIADGMSTDNTREIIEHIPHSAFSIHIFDNPGKIVPTGLNLALRQAKGEIIIRVDGHTIIAPDYVCQCVKTLQRTHADNVGGRMNAIGSNSFGKAVALATSTPFGIGGGRFHYSDEEEWVDTVYMGAWPRRVFEKIGLFDEELVRDQDDEFNYRLREQGGRILLSPAIRSEYTVRSTPRGLWRQYFQYGYWKVRVLQKHPRQMSLRQFVPPLFVLSLLASAFLAITSIFHPPLTEHWSLNAIPFLLLTGIYLLANFAASLWTVINKARAAHSALFSALYSLLLLPLVFSILHISYGLGFLIGLVKFWNRWGDKVGKTPVWTGETSG